MSSPEFEKFDIQAQRAFDRSYPPQEITKFEEEGDSDWIGIFDALSAFDFVPIRPEGKEAVIELFLANRYAPQMITRKTEQGLMVYRRNIVPLLKASLEVFWQSLDYWTEDAYQAFNEVFSNTKSDPESDWKR